MVILNRIPMGVSARLVRAGQGGFNMALVQFMATTAGRAARVGAGLMLVVAGALLGGAWWIVAVVGLVPIAAGLLDFCLLAPLFHARLHATSSHP
jgi:hypothetical protein